VVRGSTVDTAVDATASEAGLLLYLGVLATLLGYILWNMGLKGLGPTRSVTYAYGIPPLAVTFGAIFLDEPVTLWLALGGALVVGGIAAAQGVQPLRTSSSVLPWRSARSHGAS
jgi:drug/metabolite transporter (DMT)-like permease